MAQNARNNVLVVGGSSGVGLAVAKLALSHLPSANVIISSSNEAKLQKAIEEVKAAKKTDDSIIDFIVGDVSKFDTQFNDVEAVLKKATNCFNGQIDHIVWTAGAFPGMSDCKEPSNNDLIEVATTRLFGPLALAHLARKYMTDTKHSSITMTSGVLTYRPMKGRGRMTAMAGGMESGTRGLAVDLAPIRVNFVVLGLIQTPLSDGFIKGDPARAAAFTEKTLLKCIGSADEAAEAYLFSMRCAYITGSRLDVEGGALLS